MNRDNAVEMVNFKFNRKREIKMEWNIYKEWLDINLYRQMVSMIYSPLRGKIK